MSKTEVLTGKTAGPEITSSVIVPGVVVLVVVEVIVDVNVVAEVVVEGALVGVGVGLVVGDTVGPAVGDEDVGAADGAKLGDALGCTVGDAVYVSTATSELVNVVSSTDATIGFPLLMLSTTVCASVTPIDLVQSSLPKEWNPTTLSLKSHPTATHLETDQSKHPRQCW